MLDSGIKICGIGVAEGLIGLAEGVGNGGADIELNDFHRLVNKIPQCAVELVGLTDLPECRARAELVSFYLKGQSVSAETIVVQMPQPVLGLGVVKSAGP